MCPPATLPGKRVRRRQAAGTLIACLLGWAQLHGAGFPWNTYAKRPDPWFQKSGAARSIADHILSHQAPNGGWPKNLDTGAQSFAGDRAEVDTTFDNGATRGELRFLARAYRATGDERYCEAFLKGLDLILTAQYANGGWPQSPPPGRGYSRYITFNDETMIGLMEFLREVGTTEDFAFVDPARRSRALQAVDRGIACILRCQIRVKGSPTAWCAQHDELTFEPRKARSYEHPSISGGESAGVCLFLMSLEDPSPRVIEAVHAACRWFEEVQIHGLRVLQTSEDRWVVEDANATPVWARFYEIGTNRPLFSGRDGVIKYALAEIEPERRRGYGWYVDSPERVLQAWSDWAVLHPAQP